MAVVIVVEVEGENMYARSKQGILDSCLWRLMVSFVCCRLG